MKAKLFIGSGDGEFSEVHGIGDSPLGTALAVERGEVSGAVAFDAVSQMRLLADKHRLGFYFNPGGGAYHHPIHGECQISAIDDRDDLRRLQEWLVNIGLEAQP